MNSFIRRCVSLIPCLLFAACDTTPAPAPYGPAPSPAQLEWQKMEYNMFVHFGPNTFTDAEWGDGQEDAGVFRPEALDCDQWVATAKAAGMKGVIITAKHHDGFCLWPSKTSTHTVAQSPWRGGKGDVLRELSDACRKYGLKFGVYLSPWDRNHPAYGTPAYNDVFRRALDEVLGNYGEVFEQWFDGACGEGPNGKRQVYDWPAFHRTVYNNQPRAIVFSDVGPGCRWIGNEGGYAGETCWSRLDTAGYEPGAGSPPLDTLNRGNAQGAAWVPGEVDVSIRPGWFYHADEDRQVKPVEKLMDIYYSSVGRNSLLLLNVPPDRRGRISAVDSVRLMQFRDVRERDFAVNLAADAVVSASATRGNSRRYAAKHIIDGNYDSYWATDEGVTSAGFELLLPEARTFNRLLLQEYIPLGQRVARFTAEYRNEIGDWIRFAEGTTIGYKRVLRFAAVTAVSLRIRIEAAYAAPLINNFGLYMARESVPSPVVRRDKQGTVTLDNTAGYETDIYYTLDGSDPDLDSERYAGSFAMSGPGEVRAIAAGPLGRSDVTAVRFDAAPLNWRVTGAPDIAGRAVDGSIFTAAGFAATEHLTIDMGAVSRIGGFSYTPVADNRRGVVARYDFWVSTDGRDWQRMVHGGIFQNIANNPVRQEVRFDKPVKARYLRLSPLQIANSDKEYAVAEIGVLPGGE
ncbi:alpha-L-fucosidase [uncultured Alistipes sp.]|uniref:alpha-L-fucosidase n=1 Tax=uncultured Alistipes sp. TaxID=538949 RepID=UPI0025F4BE7E|nr:alpha-L-fucosidase [uncultured Alistipes sp.]